MDRNSSQRPTERNFDLSSQAPHPAPYPRPFPPPTQPSFQIPPSDPFHTNRDPFLPISHDRRGSSGLQSRAWPPIQGHPLANGHLQRTPPPQQSQPLPPPPPNNGLVQMSLPYDPSRRRSLGGNGSPPQYAQGPLEPPPPPLSFQSRQMPPPSPPQMPSSGSSLLGSAPRGPPTASPFVGLPDLASFSSHRPAGAMSLSSILGASEERKPHSSPHASIATTSTPKSMPPPSPGRARATSMREGHTRGFRDVSPPRNIYGEPRATLSVFGHDRTASETRREAVSGSPLFQHGFRPYQPPQQEHRGFPNANGIPGRPNSQPIEHAPPRSVEDIMRRDAPNDGRFATFRPFVDAHGPVERNDANRRQHATAFLNGHGPTSEPAERGVFNSPQLDRDRAQDRVQPASIQFRPSMFGTPIREEQTGLFRPVYQPSQESMRDLSDVQRLQEFRRDVQRSSPPLSEFPPFEPGRNGFMNRPMTLEEHQRMEALQRDQEFRKASDGFGYRSLLNNISPELNRKGRDSPLPQAVQGAQPRHVGPGGDNPGIKVEFGRMFSGLGSGAGTATPNAGRSVNGTTTPSRISPARHIDGIDLVHTAVAEIEGNAKAAKSGTRNVRKNGRRAREDDEKFNGNGRETPDMQYGAKRAKTTHTHHHHHHHHHEPIDTGPSPFNVVRFPSNALSHSNLVSNASHHHHHHHGSHAHPAHHHHHTPRAVPIHRRPTTTVTSRKLIEECSKKPRKHLGSQSYTTEMSLPSAAEIAVDGRIKFNARMNPIPLFEGKENCTYTVRVPRWYLTAGYGAGEGEDASYLEAICKRRQIWGTEVYTDDSDVVAAAVHSGWLKGDFGEFNDDLHEVCGNDSEQDDDGETTAMTLPIRPTKPVRAPPDHDAHITLLIFPPLENYASSTQHHIWSRDWKDTHDGMSFMIQRIEFVDEGSLTRNSERTAAARRKRFAVEAAKRKEAAAGLMMFFADGNINGSTVR